MKIAPFKLERFFAQYEFSTRYLLSSSDCESMAIKDLLSLDPHNSNLLTNVWLGYTESQGDPVLRETISHLYNSIQPENVLCFTGAQEGIMAFMNTILSPGDHLIIQFPAYQSLYQIAEAIGCEITLWEMIEDIPNQKWKIDLQSLKDAVKANTKAIVINFPHNPTGAYLLEDELKAIIQIARDADLYLFSDEVYRGLEHENTNKVPAVCDIYHKGISLGVMSKTYGLAGLRIGWIATHNPVLYSELCSFKDYTTICNSAPSEFLANFALNHAEHIISRNLEIIKRNLELLDAFFSKYRDKFEWVKPQGGSVGFVKIKIPKTSMEFCLETIEKAGILLLPGELFDYGSDHFRIGFGRANFPEVLAKFEEYLTREILMK